jgi:hypothetical protein
MRSLLSKAICTSLVAGLFLALGGGSALAGTKLCSGGLSAVQQYCENVPTATGGQTPTAGMPALGVPVPPRLLRSVAGSSSLPLIMRGRHRVLVIPSVAHRGPSVAHRGHASAAALPLGKVLPKVSAWSLSLPMILVFAAVAAGLISIAVLSRRRAAGTA